MRYHRNFLNPAFCPVIVTLMWLLNTGLVDHLGTSPATPARRNVRERDAGAELVCLFPKFAEGFKGVLPFKRHNTNMVRTWFLQLFEAAGMADLVPHSLRTSGLIWAARCYAQEWQGRVSGRWGPKSTAFMDYMQEGFITKDDYVSRCAEDPIFKFWVWKFGVINGRPHVARRQRRRNA